MAEDGQVCFHRRLFANPVKPQRCTIVPVRPLNGINKDVGGAKLLLTTTSVYPVDCACICPLLKTQHHCLCPNGKCNPPSASHPPPTPLPVAHPLIHAIPDITVTVKKVAKNLAVLATVQLISKLTLVCSSTRVFLYFCRVTRTKLGYDTRVIFHVEHASSISCTARDPSSCAARL